ncbi:MAG: SprT-like domain-containing protein [Candidatus Schekmanbacteria bacterium]|nr:SprT-like domain-containing protein [Candidatus Schekmanbacteria bacterium]
MKDKSEVAKRTAAQTRQRSLFADWLPSTRVDGLLLLGCDTMLRAEAQRIAWRLGWPGEVEARWNRRMRSNAGRTTWFDSGKARLELNHRLLVKHPGRVWETLAHEVCHLVAGPVERHGVRWQDLMAALGLPPARCHTLDTTLLKVRRRCWRWICRACGRSMIRQHRRPERYRCLCGGKLAVVAQCAQPFPPAAAAAP